MKLKPMERNILYSLVEYALHNPEKTHVLRDRDTPENRSYLKELLDKIYHAEGE
jgi:hypothetical protein